ncbi:related to aryl-alcohol dehydrogenase YPL088W [Zygosaccharomyces bailii ISA1307]|nr:related to aryl-alcohol dehydrogenase YPL088W [Zygosaccharomyces bailii ISA1307]
MALIEQVKLAGTGLKISPIVVGCASFGSKSWAPWVLEEEEEVFAILKYCYDIGLRTFDTADSYSNGKSERLLGKFLKKYNIKRETVVILSKIYNAVDESLNISSSSSPKVSEASALELVNQRGLSRKHVLSGVAQSVERLGTYIDILQIHRFDPDTPIGETMRALNDVVEKGLARYIGASTMLATEFVEMQHVAENNGWFKFVSWQLQYSLLYREEEREAIPYSKRHDVGLIAWSPNGMGLLTRPVEEQTERSRSNGVRLNVNEKDKEIINRVQKLSNMKDVSMAAISTAWVMHKGVRPIVGMNSIDRVKDVVSALKIELDAIDLETLEELYVPKPLK